MAVARVEAVMAAEVMVVVAMEGVMVAAMVAVTEVEATVEETVACQSLRQRSI